MNFLVNTWLKLRVSWSNVRNKNNISTYSVTEKITLKTFNFDVPQIAKSVYSDFEYKYDDATELFDSMRFPAQCYHDYRNGKLIDDCDGFHACMYHILVNNGYDCALLTYIPQDMSKSHTVLLIRKTDKVYAMLDYRKLTTYGSIEECIKYITEKNGILLGYNLVKFDNKKYFIVKTL